MIKTEQNITERSIINTISRNRTKFEDSKSYPILDIENHPNTTPKSQNLNKSIRTSESNSFIKRSQLSKPSIITFAEAQENCHGNYFNYVTKCLKSIQEVRKVCDEVSYIKVLEDRKINLGPLPEGYKKTLVLDLDETLIHADINNEFENTDETVMFGTSNRDYEIKIPINFMIRPGLKQFLESVSSKYEIIIFTASKQEYADTILNHLDPTKKLIKHRLFRDQCIPLYGKIFIKDLRIFNDRDLANIIIDGLDN